MHVVAITGWGEETAELVQGLAEALGISAYEARQRMIGRGPAVVASFKEAGLAEALAGKLEPISFSVLIVDVMAVQSRASRFIARRFQFLPQSFLVETDKGQSLVIPYKEIKFLLPLISIVGNTATETVTERKLSIGKTLATGGIPMFSKGKRQKVVRSEERGKVLYVFGGEQSPVVFGQHNLTYEGFGDDMKLSREQNFTHLINEFRRFCSAADYDDRLLNRLAQSRLLGPTLEPEKNLALAAEILALSRQP